MKTGKIMTRVTTVLLLLALSAWALSGCGGAKEAKPDAGQAQTPAAEVQEPQSQVPEPQSEPQTEQPASAAGEYRPFAVESEGYRIAFPDTDDEDGKITMNEDGTGVMLTGDVENRFLWKTEGDKIIWMDESGSIEMPVTIKTIGDGIFTMEYEGMGLEQDITMYYARGDADTSGIETITQEEYQQMQGADN